MWADRLPDDEDALDLARYLERTREEIADALDAIASDRRWCDWTLEHPDDPPPWQGLENDLEVMKVYPLEAFNEQLGEWLAADEG